MRALPAALAASALLALTACGGDGGPGPTAGTGSTSKEAPITSDAPASTDTSSSATSSSETSGDSPSESSTQEPTSTSTTSTDTGKPFDAQEFTGKLQRAVDANPTVKIDVTAKIAGQQDATASGVQDLGKDALEMQVNMGGQELGYRLVDGQYYLAQPPKWVPVTEDTTNPLVQSTLEQIKLLSMRRQLDAFIAGVESAGDKGEEEVDGVTTTHYTATVNSDKALAKLDMDRAEGAPDRVIYDVWLDDDDLIRKMSFNLNGATATMTATDWGKPVTIAKPKDSELAKVP